MEDIKICDFLSELESSSPTPGGGGAAALTGAIGAALASMVGNLTTGKKKYAGVQEDIERMLKDAGELREQMYGLIEKDAEGFKPLAAAYALPKDTPEQKEYKRIVMEEVLSEACVVPLEIMRCALSALKIQEEMAEKGSVMAVSDAGAGAAILQGALNAASLNVYINAKSLTDREHARTLISETESMLDEGNALAEKVFNSVRDRLKA